MADVKEVPVPDIGDFDSVEVIEVLISSGDTIAAEDSLITLESDKASMEIPAPFGGKVKDVKIKVGDSVAQGDIICTVEAAEEGGSEAGDDDEPAAKSAESEEPAAADKDEGKGKEAAAESHASAEATASGPTLPEEDAAKPGVGPRTSPTAHIDAERQRKAHATPAVRRFARELGVDLLRVEGTGRKGRILKEDVKAFVKKSLAEPAGAPAAGGLGVSPMPEIDFSEFGEVETKPLSKINKLTGRNLHRNWVTIPHVTQFDKADITDLESFRKELNEEQKSKGIKITLVSFLLKACAAALREFPRFNSSLDPAGENLILKQYCHVGVAVDTPDGLVVPVIRDVDRKSLNELAGELMELSQAARDKKLSPKQMQGGCISISSLGGVGGTAFTPIVNAPEVAILGASKASMEPVYVSGEFVPRLMLPLSLSYDHRVIDGADAARFTTYIARVLGDLRRLVL